MNESTSLTTSAVFSWADQSAGWIYLLPPLGTRHVLCLDPPIEIAWLMSRICRWVTIAYTSHEAATYAGMGHAELKLERTTWVSLDRILEAAAVTTEASPRFDGLLIHDPQARVIHTQAMASIHRLAESLPTLLSRGAFVYLSMRRRWSLFRIPRDSTAPAGSRPLMSFGAVARSLRLGGFDLIRRWPMLLSGSRVIDIVDGGYRASTNGALWRERAKEFLLGPAGAQVFAPAYGWVATTFATPQSVLDDVSALVRRVVHAGDNAIRLTQYRLARGDKAILGFEILGASKSATIAVISEDPSVIRGRRIESGILDCISRLPEPLACMVPRNLGEFQVGHHTCFLITALPGVTLDTATDSLQSLTDQALDFLKAFHVQTAIPTRLDTSALDLHVGSVLRDAIVRNPDLAGSLGRLSGILLAALQEHTLPTVFTHGDYKIENVMYSRETGRITGVIDWEHASPAALPLIDALYLLFYNRILKGAAWLDVLGSIVDRALLDERENDLIDDYLASIRMPVSFFPALAAVFLAHHIGRRITLAPDAEVSKRLRWILDELGARISASIPQARVPGSS